MKLSDWVHAHQRSILFLLAMLTVAGLYSSVNLPVALFPQVQFPRVAVSLNAGDLPAERMAVEVTSIVEDALRAIPGVRNIRSTTSRGSASISINFEWNLDMIAATLEVEAAINKVMGSLPLNTAFEVRRMDPTVYPVISYSLISNTRSLVELRDIAFYQLRPMLTPVTGVAKIDVVGGAIEEYRIDVDPAKLYSYGLTLDDIAKSLASANILTAVGRLEDRNKLYLIVSNTSFTELTEIEDSVLRADPNGIVTFRDVATVRKDTSPQWIRVTADGQDAVLFQVYQQPGGNTVQIAKDIKACLNKIRNQLPPDVKIVDWYDQSELIISSTRSVFDAVFIGIACALVILLLILRNIKITLIAAIIVPCVLAVTILMLAVLGMSFNIMTLGGMAAAVGLIIDDAIVMIEHVVRRVRGGTGHYRSLIALAATEFTSPLTGSSASTIIIFIPLAFLSGVTGAFFKALSLTMAASLFISFLVAWLVVPLLAMSLLNDKDSLQEEGRWLMPFLQQVYGKVMHMVLPRPWVIATVIIPLIVLGWFAYLRTGSGFMPKMDEGGFVLDYVSAPGTALMETDRMLKKVEEILRATPEVHTYSRRTGTALGGDLMEANEGDFFVRLKPMPRRNIKDVMEEVRLKVEHSVPSLEIQMILLMEDLIGDLTAVPQPIEIKLFSDDGKLLGNLAPKVAKAIEQVPGVVDVKNGVVLAGDALEITLDRQKASLEGVNPESITSMLSIYAGGQVATQVMRGPKMVGVRVWVPDVERGTDRSLLDMMLRAPDGHLFPLKRVATITPITGQPQINRDDLKRMIAVTGRISGRDMGSTIRDIKNILTKPGLLPAEIYFTLGGLYAQQQIAFRGLAVVVVAAVFLVFFLLLFLYERFCVAVAMMTTTLLAMVAVFIGLWLTATELNITSLMGLTMVVGIVTEVSIFYYSEFYELPAAMLLHERLIQAGQNRMRPIAMTTLAAICTLAPLALGIGQGSAMQQPLAIAIIAGLSAQLPLALIVLPALLVIFRVPEHEQKIHPTSTAVQTA